MTPLERFMAKVRVDEGGCWHWIGHVMPNGYGQFRTAGSSLAHRWAYANLVAPIPAGMDIDHLCRVRDCVNPAHLEPVTRSENLQRGWDARPSKTCCVNGHPLVEDNLTPPAGPRGQRQCRICAAERKRRYKLRRRTAAVNPTENDPTQGVPA